jgi:hypothetical protein
MTEPSANAIWYCVVVRDAVTKRFQHYRCFWNEREAEIYKLQLEQAGDAMQQSAAIVAIETLPGGELPQRVIS